jgi:hypothetical protein
MFQSHTVDNSMQKDSSFPFGFYLDVPICDEYDKGEHKGLDQKLMMPFSLSVVEQPYLYVFKDPAAALMESYISDQLKF